MLVLGHSETLQSFPIFIFGRRAGFLLAAAVKSGETVLKVSELPYCHFVYFAGIVSSGSGELEVG